MKITYDNSRWLMVELDGDLRVYAIPASNESSGGERTSRTWNLDKDGKRYRIQIQETKSYSKGPFDAPASD